MGSCQVGITLTRHSLRTDLEDGVVPAVPTDRLLERIVYSSVSTYKQIVSGRVLESFYEISPFCFIDFLFLFLRG